MKVQDLFETTDPELAWYIVRISDDKIGAGPYLTRNNAFAAKLTKQWYNPTDYDIAYGWGDEDDVFHDAPIKEGRSSNAYTMRVTRGRVSTARSLDETSLTKLSNEFMSNAEKNQVRRLDIGSEATFKHELSPGDRIKISISRVK